MGVARVVQGDGTSPAVAVCTLLVQKGSRPISRVLSRAIIPLGPASPRTSSGLPGGAHRPALRPLTAELCWALPPYLALLQVGFAVPSLLPRPRCALTAPFHPCRPVTGLGGLLSVALSVGSRPPGVTWHPVCRSPDFPPPRTQHARSSDCLADSRASPYTLLRAGAFAHAALFTACRLYQSVSLIARGATELRRQRGDASRGQLIEQQ